MVVFNTQHRVSLKGVEFEGVRLGRGVRNGSKRLKVIDASGKNNFVKATFLGGDREGLHFWQLES